MGRASFRWAPPGTHRSPLYATCRDRWPRLDLTLSYQSVVGFTRTSATDSRIDSVTELVQARQRVSELETQLTEAKKDDKKAYVRATKDGWSVDELKKLGLDQQATARRRQTTKKPADNRPANEVDA